MSVEASIVGNSLLVVENGNSHTISRGHRNYDLIIDAIRAGEEDKVAELLDINHSFKDSGFKYDRESGLVTIDDKEVPAAINKKIIYFIENNIDFEYLVKFWRKLNENPSFNSRGMLFKFLEHNGHPITKEGNFIAYRSVTSDFKDHHSRTFDNSIGAICEVERRDVDDNPNNTCSHGLHVACHSYASTFGSNKNLVLVEVDPADVVAVPRDYNGTKMRVCKFKVLALCDGELEKEFFEVE